MIHRRQPPPWAFWPSAASRHWWSVRAAFGWHVLRRCPECRVPRRNSVTDASTHKMDCSNTSGRYQ